MFKRMLIVCTGNICRSPLAEMLLKGMLPNTEVRSAGILTDKSDLVGSRADHSMIRIAHELGEDLSLHRAHQLTVEDCIWSDIILVMEPDQIRFVSDISIEARGKTFLLGQWGEGRINDPFMKSSQHYQTAATQIQSACQSWQKKL